MFKMNPGSKEGTSEGTFRMSTPFLSNGGDDKDKPTREQKKAARSTVKNIRKQGKEAADADYSKEGAPTSDSARSIAKTAGWAAKIDAKERVRKAGGSKRDARKAGRAAKKEAVKGTKEGIKQSDKAAWDNARKSKKDLQKDPTNKRKQDLYKEASKNKRSSGNYAKARAAKKHF